MSLFQTLKNDQLQARKDRDSATASLLTTLIGEAAMVGKNDGNRESTDSEVLATIKKFVKNINESLAVRNDAALQHEKTILESYLPVQLTDTDLRLIIYDLVTSQSTSNMGSVMQVLKTKFNGRYDGKVASTIVKELLVT